MGDLRWIEQVNFGKQDCLKADSWPSVGDCLQTARVNFVTFRHLVGKDYGKIEIKHERTGINNLF